MSPVPNDPMLRPWQIVARGLRLQPPGPPALVSPAGLSFRVDAGLTLVLGDEGRGKTVLLRLLAGRATNAEGSLRRGGDEPACWPDPLRTEDDAMPAIDWLRAARGRWPRWDDDAADAAIEALALGPHLEKTLSMLSAGTRRKLGLVEADASGAHLTLLDTPFAALDAASRRWLAARLRAAAAGRERAWVVADYAPPPGVEAGIVVNAIRLD